MGSIRGKRKVSFSWSAPITLLFAAFLLSNAWWRIQSIRIGYRLEEEKSRLGKKKEELSHLDKKISLYHSIATLDRLARKKYKLHTPNTHQIIYLSEVVDNS